MKQKIFDFYLLGYKSDPLAFYCELSSFVFTVGASLILAITAQHPNMLLIYPGFMIGAILGTIGYWRRTLAWPMMLTGYFIIINFFGFGRAADWW
jgi:hypothetical protein